MKKHLVKLAALLAGVGALGVATPSAQAGPMTLQALLNGSSLRVGDMMFTNFTNFSSTAKGATAVDPSQVFVTAVVQNGKIGLQFKAPGQFKVGQNQSQFTHFEFNMVNVVRESVGPASLAFRGLSHGQESIAAVSARFTNMGNQIDLSTDTANQGSTDWATPSKWIHVAADVKLIGSAVVGAFASMDEFTLMCEQPEPGTLTLLGIGVVGLVGYRWRRRG